MRNSRLIALALALVAVATSRAQEVARPITELINARVLYRDSLSSARQQELRRHVDRLSALERSLRLRGKTAAADLTLNTLKVRRAEIETPSRPPRLPEEAPIPLQVLEFQHADRLKKRVADLRRSYRGALKTLATKYKANGHLDGVLSIEQEFTNLDSLAAAASKEDQPRRITLGALNATPAAPVRQDLKHRLLISWKAGGRARWDLKDLPAGHYRVDLNYYAGPFSGGSLKLELGESSRTISIEATDSWQRLKTQPVAEFNFEDKATTLAIQALEARGLGVFEFSSVDLVVLPTEPAPR